MPGQLGGKPPALVRTRWPEGYLLRSQGPASGTGHAEARGGVYRAGEETG